MHPALKRIFTVVVLELAFLSGVEAQGTTYATSFPLTENPISESGHWTTGRTMGLDWSNVRTAPGLAFGTQNGLVNYNDSVAILNGSWGPTQTASAKVHTKNRVASGVTVSEEVELLLRFSISAHHAAGYEATFSVNPFNSYVQVNRWNGALGSFTLIDGSTGPGISDGDTVEATISGTTITLFINGSQVLKVNDSTFASGSPGMGFYYTNFNLVGTYAPSDYGFTSFSASDNGTPPPPPPAAPSNLRIIK
jgi:hypothetical protein